MEELKGIKIEKAVLVIEINHKKQKCGLKLT